MCSPCPHPSAIMPGMNWITTFWLFLRAFFLCRSASAVENLALRQQLAVLRRSVPKPKLHNRDRRFWVRLSRLWAGWQSVLIIVSPDTVVRWHRDGFRRYWRWKSRGKPGRPTIARDVIALIRRLNTENPLWGAPRIQSELHFLGCDVAKSSVAKYMTRSSKPPSQTWRTFIKNHVGSLASIDFFVVPTVAFRLLYGFVVLRHDRREIVHFNVTASPTAAWVSQQLRNAFPFDAAPKYLIRDRDGIYGQQVRDALEQMGIKEILTAPRSPWQNPFVERIIGSIRRECLDHVIVFNERGLYRILQAYFDYYHRARTHQSLENNAPFLREIEAPDRGKVIAAPEVGGLHHSYKRVA